jgi:excisionase family DNA binding protein
VDPKNNLEPGYRPREVARLLRVGTDKVFAWIRSGDLSAVNTGGPGKPPRFVILREDLRQFIERNRVSHAPGPRRAFTPRRQVASRDYYAE